MNHPYLITAGFVCLVAIVAAGLTYRSDIALRLAKRRLAKGLDDPEIDEDWAARNVPAETQDGARKQ